MPCPRPYHFSYSIDYIYDFCPLPDPDVGLSIFVCDVEHTLLIYHIKTNPKNNFWLTKLKYGSSKKREIPVIDIVIFCYGTELSKLQKNFF